MKARYHNGDAGNYIGQHLFGDDNQAMEIPNVILEVDEFDDVIEVAPNILDGLYVRINSGALGEAKCGNFIVGQKAAEMEFADEFVKGSQKWSSRNTIIQLLTAAAVDAVQCGEFEVGPDNTIHAYYKLSTGLPVNEAKDSKRKEAFKNKLESYTHLVQFVHAPEPFAGKIVKIHYQRVLVNSEGNAAHVDLSRDDDLKKRVDRPFTEETYLLNDIGGGTYDIGVIRDGRRIDSEASRSYELGLSPEIDKIIEEVADKYGYRFPSRHAFTVCATKKDYRILLKGTEEVNIREIATKYLKPLAHEVLKKLDATWNRVPEAVTAAFIGGGALLLRPYLEELNGGERNLWFCESAEESRWAIARAYAKLNRIYDLMHTASK